MKLSTKGRYGVRFMLDLALHRDEGCMTLKEVAAHQKISEKYLWQVIHPLKAAGLIRAARAQEAAIRWPVRRRELRCGTLFPRSRAGICW